jgi:hypothetical protein
MGFGDNPLEGGFGMGKGIGRGERPEEKTDTGHYDSKVAAKLRPGEVVRTGDAGGPNVAGQTQEQVKEQILSSLSEEPDPISNQKLPRAQREHARQYNELYHNLYRNGEK